MLCGPVLALLATRLARVVSAAFAARAANACRQMAPPILATRLALCRSCCTGRAAANAGRHRAFHRLAVRLGAEAAGRLRRRLMIIDT